jgi:flagellar motility protein MotE (MotC chaperone)
VAGIEDEKGSYSGFERFLFFITPILFTAVLLGVLLLMFNNQWRNTALEIGNKIPLLKSVIPDPSSPSSQSANTDEELTVSNARDKVDELQALLTDREAALKQATAQSDRQKKQIDDLQIQIDDLTKQGTEKAITTDAYQKRISSLATMYGKMTPSKAAPILENMTQEESALVLGAMSETERGRVLERMNPKTAAEVSMMLKDADTVDQQQVAALQSRIKELEKKAGAVTTSLDTAKLNKTFSAMKPKDAAALLLRMVTKDQSKVLQILAAVDDTARSGILSEMRVMNDKVTAALVSKMMPAKS